MLSLRDMHPYQRRTVDFILENPSAFLIQGLGLGKTVATLTAIAQLKDEFMAARTLVIAPLRVAQHTWPAEIEKWSHLADLTMAVAVGTAKQRLDALNSEADIYVINRENIPLMVNQFAKRWRWDVVVVDESSSFKSSKARRFKSLKRMRKHIDRMILLTGTPCSNSLLDLWSQAYLLDEGKRLGKTYTGFRDRYFEADYMGYNFTPRDWAEDKIHSQIADLCLSMRVEDYLTLPDKIVRHHKVPLSPAALKTYNQMKKDMFININNQDITAVSAGVLCNKLQQLAQGEIYTEDNTSVHVHDAKLDALEDLLEAAGEDNVLVAYTYKHDLTRIKARFPHAIDVREPDAITRWQKGEVNLMCAHPASAGHGLNLQAGGHRIIWIGLTWSLELWEQFNARLYRQGQEHPVIIHTIQIEDSIDQQIMGALESKRFTQDAMIDAVKAELC